MEDSNKFSNLVDSFIRFISEVKKNYLIFDEMQGTLLIFFIHGCSIFSEMFIVLCQLYH